MSARRRLVLLIAIWSVPAWLMVAESRALGYMAGTPASPLSYSIPTLMQWYAWVGLTPVVMWLSARFPLDRWPVALSNVGVHALGAIGVSAVNGFTLAALRPLFVPVAPSPLWPAALRLSIGWLPFAAVTYGAVLAAGAALRFAKRLGEREAAAARMGEQLARAQLDAIRARIHPHFLFNALHSVAALVRTGERDDAVRVVSDLSDLLREVLAQDTPDLVPLETELTFVRRYLAIESVRFSDRLRVEWSLDPTIADVAVPPLLVQALVENAVRHGVSRSGLAGQIAVAARDSGGFVEITVTDDGPGLAAPASARRAGTGFGIEAARTRLRALLGAEADLSVESPRETGTVARVRVPVRRLPSGTTVTAAELS